MNSFESQSFSPSSEPLSPTTNTSSSSQRQQGRPPTTPGTKWVLTEICLLVEAKRLEADRTFHASARERMRTDQQKLDEIVQALARRGFRRTPGQIRSKWDRITAEFKRIFDYHESKPSGEPLYWDMDREQREKFKLPKSYSRDVYDLLMSWFPRQRAVRPQRSNLMDSSSTWLEENEPDAWDSQQWDSATDGYETGNEENIAPQMNAANISAANVFPRVDVNGRRKKTKRYHFEEQFTKVNREFLEAMEADNEKRAEHDKEILN
jgi:hypothetical protein